MSIRTCDTRFRTAVAAPILLATLAIAGLRAAQDLVAQTPNDVPAPQLLSEDQQVIHLLNRLAYGPRPGDIDRVKRIGIEAYIEQQLRPELIPDPVVEQKLAGLTTLNLTLEEGERVYRLVDAQAVRRQETADRKTGMAGGMTTGSPSDRSSVDSLTAARLRRGMLNSRVSGKVVAMRRPPEREIFQARMVRAVHSERQLLEMMVDFWMNHFNVLFDMDEYLPLDYEERAIRPHAMGNFEDLLVATATHPAMLLYLDNWLSTAPEEVVRQRLEAGYPVYPDGGGRRALALRQRRSFFEEAKGLNENYGRELMELHTLGVEGGYTQEDVVQVAKAFTGWTVPAPEQRGYFAFDPLLHVDGDKVVLGQTIQSGGMDEGMQILKMLAHHPSTAHFISTKLVRRFVADDPPAEIIEAASRTFEETGGDIREVLRTIFTAPQFFAPRYYQVKLKKPVELVASALRAVGSDIDVRTDWGPGTFGYLYRRMARMGEALYQHEAPDGYPDVASAWISTSALFQRLEFAVDLAIGQVPDAATDVESAQSLFEQLGFPEPTPAEIAQAQSLVAKARAPGSISMMGTPMMQEEAMGQRARQSAQQGAAIDAQVIAAAVALGSPRFQKR